MRSAKHQNPIRQMSTSNTEHTPATEELHADRKRMAVWALFLGHAPQWYKLSIAGCLLANPLIYWALLSTTDGGTAGTIVGWLVLLEFIFTLAMALRCYPLLPGGLIAIQGIAIGLATPEYVYKEVQANLPVILLITFMVAAIHFMKDILILIFSRIVIRIQNKRVLSLSFMFLAAFLSAFLDALTVTAAIITIGSGFLHVYNKAAEKSTPLYRTPLESAPRGDIWVPREDLQQFRRFLRDLMMHAAIGTALGGVATTVGEPQNLMIAEAVGWDFIEFYLRVMPVSLPILFLGLLTCYFLERFKLFGYGNKIPDSAVEVLRAQAASEANLGPVTIMRLTIQALGGIMLVIALAFHVAEVGLIGLALMIGLTSFTGVIKEGEIGKAFEEPMPFAALLVVFFAVVAILHAQHVFDPIMEWVYEQPHDLQPVMMFLAAGLLSIISDNVFVASVYMGQVQQAFVDGEITEKMLHTFAIALNTGTNLPSVATPNGQAAFLFLLTSQLAPLIRLSYLRMVYMALPHAVLLTVVGAFLIWWNFS